MPALTMPPKPTPERRIMKAVASAPRTATPRPRGLWHAREEAVRRVAHSALSSSQSQASTSSVHLEELIAPRRLSTPPVSSDGSDESEDSETDLDDNENDPAEWYHRTKMVDTTTTAMRGQHAEEKVTCDLDDWEDLKELFIKGQEQFDNDDYAETLPILRGVIHECHRFMLFHTDPSPLFVSQHQKLEGSTQPQDPAWSSDTRSQQKAKAIAEKRKNLEIPTAFHTVLGTTLFMFGNVIAQEPSLAAEGEPNVPVPYWLAAIAAFETGESIPVRTEATSYDYPEDWRLAVMWGRTLMCIADEILTRAHAKETGSPNQDYEEQDHPEWPEESPFYLIFRRRPPAMSPMSLNETEPTELLEIAMDQFARGILHMPHLSGSSGASSSSSAPLHRTAFSRPRELYNIASSVLIVAEKLDSPAERRTWATQAESLFGQMNVEMLKTSIIFGAGDVEKMRGRCWLIVGSSGAEELDEAMEDNGTELLDGSQAKSARDALAKAVELLEKAKSLNEEAVSEGGEPDEEVSSLLAEALITLANLSNSDDERDQLYERAKAVGGDDVLDTEKMDLDESP